MAQSRVGSLINRKRQVDMGSGSNVPQPKKLRRADNEKNFIGVADLNELKPEERVR